VGSLSLPTGDKGASLIQTLLKHCTVRGLLVGSRQHSEEMNRAIEMTKIKPVVDKRTFVFEDLLHAYQYQFERKHFGKVAVTL
jgi:NADPH:quinone reductase-like Zn-dependent oxidoreductase